MFWQHPIFATLAELMFERARYRQILRIPASVYRAGTAPGVYFTSNYSAKTTHRESCARLTGAHGDSAIPPGSCASWKRSEKIFSFQT